MIEKPNKFRSAILGGLVIGTIAGIPGLNLVNCCCCAGVVVGGVMAFFLYREEFTEGTPPLESSDALIVGLMAGVVGAIVSTVLSLLVMLLFGSVEEKIIRGLVDKLIAYAEANGNAPAESFSELQSQLDRAFAESRAAGTILRGLIFSLVLYPIFAMLGGLIGYGFFGKKKTPAPLPPQGM